MARPRGVARSWWGFARGCATADGIATWVPVTVGCGRGCVVGVGGPRPSGLVVDDGCPMASYARLK